MKYYPDTGPFRRSLYPKHMKFFAAGKTHRERCMMAANRIGKTDAACCELTYHLTGQYPEWWMGKRFRYPTVAWIAGDTSTTTRDILQKKLFGEYNDIGSGFIPGQYIVKTTNKPGIREAIDTATMKHFVDGKFDGYSSISIKSYDQKRKSFQGGKPDIIVLDEEPPNEIYVECLLRTMTNNGLIILTFTPLMGMTELVRSFLEFQDLTPVEREAGFQAFDEDKVESVVGNV